MRGVSADDVPSASGSQEQPAACSVALVLGAERQNRCRELLAPVDQAAAQRLLNINNPELKETCLLKR